MAEIINSFVSSFSLFLISQIDEEFHHRNAYSGIFSVTTSINVCLFYRKPRQRKKEMDG